MERYFDIIMGMAMLRSLRIAIVFFFFKQKTAYEIKECDWSSDVCSSDLAGIGVGDSPVMKRMAVGFRQGGAAVALEEALTDADGPGACKPDYADGSGSQGGGDGRDCRQLLHAAYYSKAGARPRWLCPRGC